MLLHFNKLSLLLLLCIVVIFKSFLDIFRDKNFCTKNVIFYGDDLDSHFQKKSDFIKKRLMTIDLDNMLLDANILLQRMKQDHLYLHGF